MKDADRHAGKQQQRPLIARVIPLLAGVIYLLASANDGFTAFLVACLPSLILISAAVLGLIWPSDRASQVAVLGSVIGVFFSLIQIFLIGFWTGLLMGILCAATFVSCGLFTLRQIKPYKRVPKPIPTTILALKVALDEAVLCVGQLIMVGDEAKDLQQSSTEFNQMLALFKEQGWLENPGGFFKKPPVLKAPRIQQKTLLGSAFEHLTFDSGYEPHKGMPGRERWSSRVANREGHAYVLRHIGESRPWVICLNGGGTGFPFTDFGAFDPKEYHDRLGLNMLIPVLPLQGPRRIGRLSGQGFNNAVDIVHVEAQAMWDIRQLISWIRSEGGSKIAVIGVSFGAYNTALLTTLEADLECAIAGVPQTDWSDFLYRFMSKREAAAYALAGLDRETVSSALAVVSPLTRASLLPTERLAVYAGVADCIICPPQPQALIEHWGRPSNVWYQGGHVTGARENNVMALIRSTFANAGMLD